MIHLDHQLLYQDRRLVDGANTHHLKGLIFHYEAVSLHNAGLARLSEETWWTDRIVDWSEEKEPMQMLVGPMTPWSDCCKTCRLRIPRTCTGPELSPDLLL